MSGATLDVGLEVGPKRRVFAQVLRWPGWVRAARDEARAVEALAEYAPRYATVVERAGLAAPAPTVGSAGRFRVTERVEGSSTTDFGALDRLLSWDLEPMDGAEIERSVALLRAAWAELDDAYGVVPNDARGIKPATGRAPAGLRLHVAETDAMHLSWFGAPFRKPVEADLDAFQRDVRGAIVAAVRAIEPGVPPEPRRRTGMDWTPRFAVRRSAWHALDHAWELQDRAGHA